MYCFKRWYVEHACCASLEIYCSDHRGYAGIYMVANHRQNSVQLLGSANQVAQRCCDGQKNNSCANDQSMHYIGELDRRGHALVYMDRNRVYKSTPRMFAVCMAKRDFRILGVESVRVLTFVRIFEFRRDPPTDMSRYIFWDAIRHVGPRRETGFVTKTNNRELFSFLEFPFATMAWIPPIVNVPVHKLRTSCAVT